MKSSWYVVLISSALACTGSPTHGGEPEPTPTGTILVGTPNGPEAGTYLVDIVTGSVTTVDAGSPPLSVAWQGGYSKARDVIYGTSVSAPLDILTLPLGGGTPSTLLAIPASASPGAYDISVDGQRLAIQIAASTVQLWSVDLGTGTWTRHRDQVAGIDTIPLSRLRWSPDGHHLFALIDLFPVRSELVRIDLQTDEFQVISPATPVRIVTSVDVSPDGRTVAHGDGMAHIIFRNPDGDPLPGFPEIPGTVSRPTFSPDGKFIAFQEFDPEQDYRISIILMRLSDGKRWPLKVNAEFEVWLSDWI